MIRFVARYDGYLKRVSFFQLQGIYLSLQKKKCIKISNNVLSVLIASVCVCVCVFYICVYKMGCVDPNICCLTSSLSNKASHIFCVCMCVSKRCVCVCVFVSVCTSELSVIHPRPDMGGWWSVKAETQLV